MSLRVFVVKNFNFSSFVLVKYRNEITLTLLFVEIQRCLDVGVQPLIPAQPRASAEPASTIELKNPSSVVSPQIKELE